MNIETGATEREIRSAYRSLARTAHPDKVPPKEREAAEARFQNIAKAYEALTDETARENYEKYNNPDGRQAMQVGIGLPTFMTEADNYSYIVMVYLLVLVVAVPAIMYWVYRSSRGEDEEPDPWTVRWLQILLRHDTPLVRLPDLFGAGAESAKLGLIAEDEPMMAQLAGAIGKRMGKGSKLPPIRKVTNPELMQFQPQPNEAIQRNQLILFAYMVGVQFQSELEPVSAARALMCLDVLLEASPRILRGMVGVCQGTPLPTMKTGKNASTKEDKRREKMVRMMLQQQQKKPVYTLTMLNVLEFSQALVQGRLLQDAYHKQAFLTLMQLPGFDPKRCQIAAPPSDSKKKQPMGLLQYINTPASQRAGLDDMSAQQRGEVARILRVLPNLKVQMTVLDPAMDSHEVQVETMLALRLKLTHQNMLPEELAGPLYNDPMAAGAESAGLQVGTTDAESQSAALRWANAQNGLLNDHRAERKEGVAAAAVLVDENDPDVVDGKLFIPSIGTEQLTEFEQEPVPEAYAPSFPRDVSEKWWLILIDENSQVQALDVLSSSTRVMKKTLTFSSPIHPGKFKYTLLIKSNCYQGLDHSVSFNLTVVPRKAEQKISTSSAEDREVMGGVGPTIEDMFTSGTELQDDSSDDEDEAAGTGVGAAQAAAGDEEGSSPAAAADAAAGEIVEDDDDDGEVVDSLMPQQKTEEQLIAEFAQAEGLSLSKARTKWKRNQRKQQQREEAEKDK